MDIFGILAMRQNLSLAYLIFVILLLLTQESVEKLW